MKRAIIDHTVGILILLVFLSVGWYACGAKIHDVDQTNPNPVGQFLSGLVRDYAHNQELSLDTLRDQPLLLIFSTDTCETCGKEVDELRDVYNAGGTKLKLKHVLSVLVGAMDEDAEYWEDDHQIPWLVTTDYNALVFKKYCTGQVPCVLVQRPGSGIVYAHTGSSDVHELIDRLYGDLK
jgi:hypothetical protein